MNKKLPTWLAILVVLVCSVLLLRATDGLTGSQIERQAQAAEQAAIARLLPGAERVEAVELPEGSGLDGLDACLDASGETVGYIGRTTVTGYGGPVEVSAGVNLEGAITGVSVGGEAFDETAGLGDLTREAAFTDQFLGKTAGIALNEDGVDGIAGATISSRSVLSGVNAVTKYVCTYPLGLLQEETSVYLGQIWSASERGFEGDVTANVGLAEDGTIEYLTIDTPSETDGIGKLCSEPAFTDQFLGKKGPFTYGEDGIEAVSGATFTSTAALSAINAVVNGEGTQADAPLSTTVQGFGGDVTVTVKLNADNSVAGLTVDTPDETDGLGKLCSESEFTSQFVGKYAPFTYGENDIEAVSGATITSTAVINALNSIVPGGEAAPQVEAEPVPATAEAEPSSEPEEQPEEQPEETAQPEAMEAQTGEEAAEPAPAASGIEDYLRPRPASAAIAASAEEGSAASGIEAYLRERPANLPVSEEQGETEEAAQPTGIEAYLRERPANLPVSEEQGESEEAAQPTGIEAYLRERPANLPVSEEQGESEEAAQPGDLEAYLRPRPAEIAGDEAIEAEPAVEAEETPTAGSDIGAYLRPRPADIAGDEAIEAEPTGEAEETPAAGSDIGAYLRPRPAEIAGDEAIEAESAVEAEKAPAAGSDIGAYLRERPAEIAGDEAIEAEPAEEAEEAPAAGSDIGAYLRERPADVPGTVAADSGIEDYLRPRPAEAQPEESVSGIETYLRVRPAAVAADGE